MTKILMPPRHSMADKIVKAASKCLYSAAKKNFDLARIADIGEIVSGGTPSTTKSELWDGDVVWITPKDLGRPRNIEIDDSERKISPKGTNRLLPEGTVLFSSRAPIGHVGIAAIELCTNQGFKNIICSNRIYNRYLFHVLRANIEELDSLGHGNTFKEIPAKVLAEFEIPLPPLSIQQEIGNFLDTVYMRQSGKAIELPELPKPLTEQRNIVQRIEILAARITEAETLREEASEETNIISFSAFSTVIKSTNENTRNLNDICLLVTDGEHITPQRTAEGDVPLASAKNVRDGHLDFRNIDFVSFEIAEKCWKRCKPLSGDVLMVCVGATIGRVCRLDNPPDMVIVRSVALLRPNPEILNSQYLEYALKSPICQDQIWSLVKQAAQPGIYINRMKQITIPVPPLDEQRRIVAYLDSVQARLASLRELQSQTGEELDALLPSVLDRAFKGEL